MKFIKKLYYTLKIFITPSCWHRNYSTSPALDVLINARLDSGARIEIVDDYTTELGDGTRMVGFIISNNKMDVNREV